MFTAGMERQLDRRRTSCEPHGMAIPKIIHQLWKDDIVPERYVALVETWSRFNPGWERRLWTDKDLLALVEDRYPDLLAIYVGYTRNISRADLGRYLVLQTFGGVYADLDCECLRPIAPMLGDATFAIGLEPAVHAQDQLATTRSLKLVVCASFIASQAAHPFWDAVLAGVRTAVDEPMVLDQTGPYLLTRAYEAFAAKDSIRLLPEEQVYPFTAHDCWEGRVHDIEFWERATRGAYVAHYWDGTWFRTAPTPRGLTWNIPTLFNAVEASAAAESGPMPRISCLMVASGRLARARAAIEDYLRQTYADRELVIGAAAAEQDLVDHVHALDRPDVRLITLPHARAPDGATLDTTLIEAATGEAVCAWDEDTLHDPRRLEVQQQIRVATQSQACLMRRRLIWQPRSGRIGVSEQRALAGSILGSRAEMLSLAAPAADAAAWIDAMAASVRTAAFDLPRLMLWIDDGEAPAAAARFEAYWLTATTRFATERTEAVLGELSARLDIASRAQPRPALVASGPTHGAAAQLKVLVLTPVKNARSHLRLYFALLDRLYEAGARLSIGLLESDSSDGTYDALVAAAPALHRRFGSVTLLRRDYGFHPSGHRSTRSFQRRRREILARSRNRLLSGALRDEDWVLWLDCDLIDYPIDLLGRMLAAGKDIVTPHCVRPDGTPFDLNTFCFDPAGRGQDDPRHLLDGLFQPPRGEGRLYLDAFTDRELVQVDSVGGAALLVRADLHREGLNFPPYAYRGYIETEGLAMMARDMGEACWALPQLRITHADT